MKRAWKYLLGSLLGLLGFEGCDIIGFGKCEYGQPMADYQLIGEVKDTDGNPVPGIRVVVQPTDSSWDNDTLYSDARGRFEQERLRYNWPDELEKTTVRFEDVDGEASGAFRTRELKRDELELTQTRKGDGKWYHGTFTVRADAVLEKED